MRERPLVSELAAATWVLGGLVGTVVLMTLTGDTHSITRGLRAHKLAFAPLAVSFLLHIYGPEVTDPFHWVSKPLRRTSLLPTRQPARS